MEELLIFSKRTIAKNTVSIKLPRKVLYLLGAVNKRLDPMHEALRRMKESFSAEIHINGRIAAFLDGIISEGNRLSIPYLSINEDLKKFSPGGILINETIKYLDTNSETYHIEQFDISNGDEPYKLTYGGEIYHNLIFRYGQTKE